MNVPRMTRSPILQSIKLAGIGLLGTGLATFGQAPIAEAQVCNVYGCSQPGAGACNVYGCPNPGADACNVYGCPAAPPPPSNSNTSSTTTPIRDIRIFNETGYRFYALYLSPASDSDWGDNDLQGTLSDGYYVDFTFSGSACRYDVAADLANVGFYSFGTFDICYSDRIDLYYP